MPFLKAKDGTNLYYKDWGKGDPIVFVHGWCINCDSWEYMMYRLLAGGYRCIAFDQRGCGRSDQPDKGYDFKTCADDLADLISMLQLDKVILVGHSLGCGIIAQYLNEHGEDKIDKAVFISVTPPALLKSPVNPHGLDGEIMDAMIAAMKKDRPAFVRSLAAPYFNLPGYRISPDLVDWAINITLQASLKAAIEMQIALFETDHTDALKNITIGVLLQHGDKDINSPIDKGLLPTAHLIANGVLKIYKDQPHGIYMTAAEMLCADIIKFIQK